MNPALSVIFFTTLSGLGYGLLAWAGIGAIAGTAPRTLLAALAIGLLASTVGLLCSLGHLGKPLRAWRAFSQWRSSWLSREGVASVATYVPAVALGAALLPGMLAPASAGAAVALSVPGMVVAMALVVCALATVHCTAMIYASLKPVPAWTHRSVPVLYVAFALVTGGLAFLLLQATLDAPRPWAIVLALTGVIALVVLKRGYWRAIDTTPLPATRGDAIGLPDRTATVFERPHTEGNFVTREMVFVLARKHARRLRAIATLAFGVVPSLMLVSAALVPGAAPAWLGVATLAVIAGAFVERWLFFAEARHVVSLYY